MNPERHGGRPAPDDPARCAGLRPDGWRCWRWARPGERFCFRHVDQALPSLMPSPQRQAELLAGLQRDPFGTLDWAYRTLTSVGHRWASVLGATHDERLAALARRVTPVATAAARTAVDELTGGLDELAQGQRDELAALLAQVISIPLVSGLLAAAEGRVDDAQAPAAAGVGG